MTNEELDRRFVKAAIKFQQKYAPLVQVDEEPEMLPENPSESMLDYWASRSELFERSALPTGVSREC